VRVADILNMLSDMMVERGGRFSEGELVSLGGKYPVKIITANATAKTEYTIQVGRVYGDEDYEVQQVVLSDRNGIFPDDARCEARYRMPVLARS
jgi:hypothetical protein